MGRNSPVKNQRRTNKKTETNLAETPHLKSRIYLLRSIEKVRFAFAYEICRATGEIWSG